MGDSLSTQAYNSIKADILNCALAPGMQIVQTQLAERYRIGTTPVREALQRLAFEGLVQPIPRYGYIVSTIAHSDVRELYELRTIVEPEIARLAALRGSDQQLDKLLRMADFSYEFKEPRTYKSYLDYNAQFHHYMAVISRNQRLVELSDRLIEELTRVFYLGLDIRDRAQKMRAEHIELATMIRERRSEEAPALARHQIERSQARVFEAMSLETSAATTGAQFDGYSVDKDAF